MILLLSRVLSLSSLKPNLQQEEIPLSIHLRIPVRGRRSPSADMLKKILAPEEFRTALGRALGCSKSGKLKERWNAACGEQALIPIVESPLTPKIKLAEGHATEMHFDLFQITSCQIAWFSSTLVPWQFLKCHETHFRREWDKLTYSKIEVAASLSQNSGHLPACCIKLVCPTLPAFLGNRLIYRYTLYCSMVNLLSL